jgi:hypothetical protein
MRAVVVAMLLASACEEDEPVKPKPPATAAAPAATTAKQRKDCRDTCEQVNIVAGGSDEQLRACRARCDGQAPPGMKVPHEVPRSISRAPVVSKPPAVRPR